MKQENEDSEAGSIHEDKGVTPKLQAPEATWTAMGQIVDFQWNYCHMVSSNVTCLKKVTSVSKDCLITYVLWFCALCFSRIDMVVSCVVRLNTGHAITVAVHHSRS